MWPVGWEALEQRGEGVARLERLTGGVANDVWSVRVNGHLAVGRLGTRSDAISHGRPKRAFRRPGILSAMTSTETVDAKRSVAALVAGWIGLIAHLGTGLFYLVSGLAVPAWAYVVLLVIWLALLVVAIRLLRQRPAYTLLIPVASAAIWFGALSAGDAWLNWTA